MFGQRGREARSCTVSIGPSSRIASLATWEEDLNRCSLTLLLHVLNSRPICSLLCLLDRDKAFELPVPSTWISDMKARILRNYRGSVTLQDPSHSKSKPVITYLSRQTATFRRLKQEIHEELVAGLKLLEQESIAEVQIEEFTDSDPKEDQVAKLSRTTVRLVVSPGVPYKPLI
jgi:hypothetical protein